jgi:hypothetical protein
MTNATRIVLDELVEAAGGLGPTSKACEVPTRTVLLWLTGANEIPLAMRVRLGVLARRLGMWQGAAPHRSGAHALAPEFVLRAELPRRVRRA